MALYRLSNPYDLQKFNDKCKLLREKQAVVELIEKKPQRSLNQNAYLHVLLGYFASEFGYSIEEVKVDIYKRTCNPDIFICKRTNKRGNEVEYLRSSSALDTREFSLSIERFRNYSSSVAGLYLPSANEGEALMYAQQQIEQYAEFT